MLSGIYTYYFLGADTRYGYYSLFGSLLSSTECERQYIIKGGHANGKDIFLKKLAELITASGHDVECYRGTANPEYIEGVYIPSLKTVFLDGEIPHAVNAQYPGAVEEYIDLGVCYDSAGLKRERDSIIRLTTELEQSRTRLTRYLCAAGEMRDNISGVVRTDRIIEAIKGRAGRNAAREFKKTGSGQGSVSYRFLSSVTETCDYSSVTAQCRHVSVLDNDLGLSAIMLPVILNRAVSQGYGVAVCLDPLEPERIAHLIIPSLSLAYISKTGRQQFEGGFYKHFRLDALSKESMTAAEKMRVKTDKRLFLSLLENAAAERTEIKRLTVRLGDIYTRHFDTASAGGLAEEYVGVVLLG